MTFSRRTWLAGLLGAAILLAGCATTAPPAATPQERAALAPAGKLRVGVYNGSPTSMLTGKDGQKVGIAYELGRGLAQRLGVPFEPVEFRRIAEVVDAMAKGEVDFTFTNATEARAKVLDFTPVLVQVELGYLVPPGSTLQNADEIDRPGMRVAVIQGGTTASILAKSYRHAQVVQVASPEAAGAMLAQRRAEAFTTNKGILFEVGDTIPGARVLPGRWGLENMAIGIPKGRDAGLPLLKQYAADVRAQGTLRAAVQRAGLRGTVEP